MDDSWRVMTMNPILTLFTALLHTPLAAIQATYRSLQHQAGFSSSQTFFEVSVKPPNCDAIRFWLFEEHGNFRQAPDVEHSEKQP
jgi:hypothetical protein